MNTTAADVIAIHDSIYDVEMGSNRRYRQIVAKLLYKTINLMNVLRKESSNSTLIIVPNFYDFRPGDSVEIAEFIVRQGAFLLNFIRQNFGVEIQIVNLECDPNHHYELLVMNQAVHDTSVFDTVTTQRRNKSVSGITFPCRSDIIHTHSLLRRKLNHILRTVR